MDFNTGQLYNPIKKYWSVFASLMVLGGLVLAYFTIPSFHTFLNTAWEVIWSNDEERITNWFMQFGLWGPVLIIVLMVVQMFLLIFPTWLPMIVAVLGYGQIWGVVISVTAVFVSSTIGYFIGEKLAEPAKNNLVGEKNFRKLSHFMKMYGFGAVVLFRISPFLSNDAISFIAGIIKMGYKKYILASMIGIVPLAVAIAWFGKDTESLEKGLYWIGGFGIVIYVIYLVLKLRERKQEE